MEPSNRKAFKKAGTGLGGLFVPFLLRLFITSDPVRSGGWPGSSRGSLDATAFAVASMSVLPFLSDQFDTLKDIIFGALCVQSEHWAIKVLGVLSWLYLLAFHAWFVFCAAMKETREFHDRFGLNPLGANCFSELATSHRGRPSHGAQGGRRVIRRILEGTILPTLYKQLTPSKREYLLIENLPQAVLSLLFLFLKEGPCLSWFLT